MNNQIAYSWRLAVKNISRARRRTILTFLMLTFGAMMFLVLDGMFAGFDKTSFENYINLETGHLKIRSADWDEDDPFNTDNLIEKPGPLIQKLRKKPYITGVTARISFLSEIDNGIDSWPVITTGINPKSDPEVFNLIEYISTGSLEAGAGVIGKTLAEDLGVKQNDFLYNTFRSSKGMYTSIEVPLSGLVMTGDPKVNNSSIFIPLNEAQSTLDTTGVSEITMRTDQPAAAPILAGKLRKELGDRYKVDDWQTLSRGFAELMETKKAATGYIIVFMVIIALVGIINSILMSVYEKKREIGTYLALGMHKNRVRDVFLFEGLFIGFAGCVSGLLLGTLVNLYFVYVGIDYNAFLGDEDLGFNIMGMVKSQWVPASYIKMFFLSMAASLLASWYPARMVMKMQPVDCLRTVQ